jgi:ABC-type methionine transport system ATPase subunit
MSGRLAFVTNVRVRLTFPENLIKQPIIGRLAREFDVLPNIRRANVEDDVGWMVCELQGEDESVERALTWLVELGIGVDRMGDLLES